MVLEHTMPLITFAKLINRRTCVMLKCLLASPASEGRTWIRGDLHGTPKSNSAVKHGIWVRSIVQKKPMKLISMLANVFMESSLSTIVTPLRRQHNGYYRQYSTNLC